MIDLKTFRKINGLKQEELAAFLEVSRSFIGQVETGRSKLTEEKVAKILNNNRGWDVDCLVSASNNTSSSPNISRVSTPLLEENAYLRGQLEGTRMMMYQSVYAPPVARTDFAARLRKVLDYLRDTKVIYSDSDFASRLEMNRSHISECVNGKRPVSPAMARRISDTFPVIRASYLLDPAETSMTVHSTGTEVNDRQGADKAELIRKVEECKAKAFDMFALIQKECEGARQALMNEIQDLRTRVDSIEKSIGYLRDRQEELRKKLVTLGDKQEGMEGTLTEVRDEQSRMSLDLIVMDNKLLDIKGAGSNE